MHQQTCQKGTRMTERQFRYFSTALLVIPFVLLADAFIHPIPLTINELHSSDARELLYPLICVPILLLFDGAWFYPQIIQEVFGLFRPEGEHLMTTPAATPAKKNSTLIIIAALIGGVIFLCFGCAVLGAIGNMFNKTATVATSAPGNITEVDVSAIQTAAVQTALAGVPAQAQATEEPVVAAPQPTDVPAPTETPQPLPSEDLCRVGEQCQANGIALTVLNVSKMDSISIFNPESGNTYLVLEVLIENVSRSEDTPYNPMYFSLKDADGFEYSITMASPDPSLKSGDLRKGDKARGFVSFEVKSNASGFVVSYKPLVILGGYDAIHIDLGQ
jgi:hypothetical protein